MLVFSLIIVYESWKMPQRVEFGPGMGFLPFWLSVVMAVLSILLFIDANMRKRVSIGNPFPNFRALLNVGLVLAGLGGYIALLSYFGFAVTTVLFIAFLLGIVQKERWFKTCIISLLATGGLYVVFRILLDEKLPKNIFGF